ncbi:hypothetical protein FRC12_020288 [Ceratobasidium sp. 428]|nr:hypothetical protein FRC12_020288 [Ceratobasidium sp. 428]
MFVIIWTLDQSPTNYKSAFLPRLSLTAGPEFVPAHRRPNLANIENIMPASRRHQHYARNAFASLELYARNFPEDIFLFQPYRKGNNTHAASKLMCGITTSYALTSALLYAQSHGAFMDATWRGMNQNYAPTTFLLGVDDKGHATPFAVLISQDIQASTLSHFLGAWKRKLHEHAHLCLPATELSNRTVEELAVIKKAASDIISARWSPSFFMIDKDAAEKNACSHVFPSSPIRICQFHVVQAILRWLKASHKAPSTKPAKKGSKATKSVLVPQDAHEDILKAFRRTQRARTHEQFLVAQQTFEASIGDICTNYGVPEQHDTICAYFQKNWWSTTWRDSVTDIGLPHEATRDVVLSTNNYSESIIKTFKHLFLGMRKNKRIDTLAMTLRELFFPFYQHAQNNCIRYAKDYIEITQSGYDLWCAVGVVEIGREPNTFDINDVLHLPHRRYVVQWPTNPSCTCTGFQQTGKRCRHMWASELYYNNGSFLEWADATNPRLGEKALNINELYSSEGAGEEDGHIPIDDNFLTVVNTWISHGQDLEDSNSVPATAHSEPLTSAHTPPDDAMTLGNSDTTLSNLQFVATPVNTGGRQSRQSPIRHTHRKRTNSQLVVSPPTALSSPSPHASQESPVLYRRLRSRTGKAPKLSIRSPPIDDANEDGLGQPMELETPLHSAEKDLSDEDMDQYTNPYTAWEDICFRPLLNWGQLWLHLGTFLKLCLSS